MIRGNPKFDSLAVGEITGSFLGPAVTLEAKAAFANSKTGDTHGWTKNTQWSPPVIEKLRELRALMEIDLGRIHLEDGGEVIVAPTNVGTRSGLGGGGGLGEHLGDGSVPSVSHHSLWAFASAPTTARSCEKARRIR